MDVSPKRPVSPPSKKSEVLLEGLLLKKGPKAKHFWHERYFVFKSNNLLMYYRKKGDEKPRAVFPVHQTSGCQVGELHVQKHQKELIYCIKLSWSEDTSNSGSHNNFINTTDSASSAPQNDSIFMDDDSSLEMNTNNINHRYGAGSNSVADSIPIVISTNNNNNSNTSSPPIHTAVAATTPSTPMLRKGRILRRGTSELSPEGVRNVKAIKNSAVALSLRERDTESLRSTPRLRHRRVKSSDNDNYTLPPVPDLVKVEYKQGQIPSPAVANAAATNNNAAALAASKNDGTVNLQIRPRNSYEEQVEEEQVALYSEYQVHRRENQRKAKKKLVRKTKIAVAAGTAIGMTVATAGVGLIAGLVALGVGSVVGTGGAAVGMSFGKKEKEIILAFHTYETARRWRACLEASLETDLILQSKWGQIFSNDARKTRAVLMPHSSIRTDYMRNIANGHGGLITGANVLPNMEAAFMHDTRGPMHVDHNSTWVPLEGGWASLLGVGMQLRIFREEEHECRNLPMMSKKPILRVTTNLSVAGRPCAAMKAHTVLSASPLDAFLCLMSHNRLLDDYIDGPNSGQRASFRIIESIDDHTDVIHLVFRPLYLFPSWTMPRDFVLYRYWRLEDDGSYCVCFESVQHADCPPMPNYVRGEMHQVYTIAPHKRQRRRSNLRLPNSIASECFMTVVVQIDPKGWVPTTPMSFLSNQGYGDAFGIAALMQALDIRDAIDQDRFVQVSLDTDFTIARQQRNLLLPVKDTADNKEAINLDYVPQDLQDDLANYDFSYASCESSVQSESTSGLTTTPPPFPLDKWAEPDANSFRVRGPDYLTDRRKINAGKSVAKLIAVDVVSVEKPLYSGMTTHPTERLQLALQKEKILKEKGIESDIPPFLFVVNIVLPGPPFYHGVFYYAIENLRDIDGSNGTASSKLFNEFFFGDSDEFRDNTFKLIPQIVQGNFIVRKAVGSTPAIMGKKLRQLYVRTDRSMELILDCGSSPVATGVIRLSLGYAKTLVVDMGFLFEGNSEDTLPERIFGAVRMKQPEFGSQLRKVEPPS